MNPRKQHIESLQRFQSEQKCKLPQSEKLGYWQLDKDFGVKHTHIHTSERDRDRDKGDRQIGARKLGQSAKKMVLRKISYDPGPTAIKDPHNLHSKRALQGIFSRRRKWFFLRLEPPPFCLPACLHGEPMTGGREGEKRHDSGKELAAWWQGFVCARFESPTLGSLRLWTETVSSTSPVHLSCVMKFCTIAVRSGKK
jgi:hypothetical protein